MPTTPSSDPALRALLGRADPAGAADPGPSDAAFADAVRRRIRIAESASPRQRNQLFPLAAAFAVLASLVAGGSLAYAGVQRERTATHADAYARSIDPWLMHADRRAEPVSPPGHLHP